jgi:hypothetical protein
MGVSVVFSFAASSRDAAAEACWLIASAPQRTAMAERIDWFM